MPSETHSITERLDVDVVVEVLAAVVGIDADDPAGVALRDLELDHELVVLDLFEAVAEELGERGLGELELDGPLPDTVGELAAAFRDALVAPEPR